MNDLTTFLTTFAVAYDCGAYGTSTYNNGDQCKTTDGSLPGTGMDVLLPLILGVVLVVSALVALVVMRKKARARK